MATMTFQYGRYFGFEFGDPIFYFIKCFIIIIIFIFIQDTHVTEVFFSGVLHYKFQLQYIYITK